MQEEKRLAKSETKAEPNLVDALFQLSFMLQGRLARIAAGHELSLIQVRLLGILRDREPTMLDLAAYLELEKSSLSGLVDRAEARGLVERVPSRDDRRATTVRMTTLGHQLSRVVAETIGPDVEALLAVLPEKDRARLGALVARVVTQPGVTLED